jgi:hypothetical protein
VKSVSYQKIFQVTLFGKLVAAFRGYLWLWKLLGKSPVILKLVPKTGYDMYNGENRLIIDRIAGTEVMRLSEQSLELVIIFKVASRTLFLFSIAKRQP